MPTAASQEDIVVVKIPSQMVPSKTEFLVTERPEESIVKPLSTVTDYAPSDITPVTDTQLSINEESTASIPAVITEVVTEITAEPDKGEDIFAKAQRMLAIQLSAGETTPEADTTPVSKPVDQVETISLPEEANTNAVSATAQTPMIPKVRPPHRHHQRGRNKGRRNNVSKLTQNKPTTTEAQQPTPPTHTKDNE